ncbi:MAG: antitermination protein NusG [Gammaproteobacteria bacterium]|nr:antitermination protein NusG [Gammaproteobacteria bacterium]
MITKLLFTLGVIAIAWLVIRNRNRPRRISSDAQSSRLAAPSSNPQDTRSPRLAAYALIGFMVLASGIVLFMQWRDEYRVVSVQVINTQTGETVTYQARRGDVEGRRFQTLDGRVVNVADIERIEMGGTLR